MGSRIVNAEPLPLDGLHVHFRPAPPGVRCAICRRRLSKHPKRSSYTMECERCGCFLQDTCYWNRVAPIPEAVIFAVGVEAEVRKFIVLCQRCRS